jgi:hypothetical protein
MVIRLIGRCMILINIGLFNKNNIYFVFNKYFLFGCISAIFANFHIFSLIFFIIYD